MSTQTLPVGTFWTWLQAHPNCILRAGTPDAVLFDDDDLHWHLGHEGDELLLVQLIRGKRLTGEMVLRPETVSYVQIYAGEQPDEHVFELISEEANRQWPAYFFVLGHSYDDVEPATPRSVH